MIDDVEQVVGRTAGSEGEPDSSDPRKLVVAGTVLSAIVVLALSVVLTGMTDRGSTSIRHARVEVETPLRRLDDALAASSEGGAQLQMAAATTGEERRRHLETAIASGEAAAKAWARYRASALPLEGEPALATRYARDYVRGKELAAKAIIPILASDRPAPLPAAQTQAVVRNEADLAALRDLYQEERAGTLLRMQERAERADQRIQIGALGCLALVLGFGLVAFRAAHRTALIRRERARTAELESFESMLVRGLELVDDDDQAWAAAARALAIAAPSSSVAISAVDHTGTAMRTTAGSMACHIERADQCPALRGGSPMHFTDSTAMSACPHLAGAPPCSATCFPISIAGQSAGVAQVRGDAGQRTVTGRAVHVVVRRVGERITMMRAIARIERQASRDPLTGLINRRTLDREVADLQAAGSAYAVAFADLDHFKRLNDVHGHHAGDQALRAFAATLADGLRSEDLACRWGGEEFVVVLPGCDEHEAAEAMERVRALLLGGRSSQPGPAVTMSVGTSVHRAGEAFAETLVRADVALATAKAAGRDRVQVWTPSPGSHARVRRSRPVVPDHQLDVVEPV